MKKFVTILLLTAMVSGKSAAQKQYDFFSPDGKLKLTVTIDEKIAYSLYHENQLLLDKSTASMVLSSGEALGKDSRLRKKEQKEVNEIIPSPFTKSAQVVNHYNELILTFRENFGLKFRMYNDGMAYRFFTSFKQPFQVLSEEVNFMFPADFQTITPYVRNNSNGEKESFDKQFFSSFENIYEDVSISGLNPDRLIFLPMLLDAGNSKKIVISEADLESYPGLYLNKSEGNSMKGVFAPYPKSTIQGGHNQLQQLVTEHENYIAGVDGTREFPWRMAIVSTEDMQLAVSDISYRLASPSRVSDISWIKPGKVAWEWWNNWNISGVDFKSGVNNETYKYYIDFASKHDIEYVILDEGWAVNLQADLLRTVPEINIPELVNYGRQKNVGIILWAGYWAFDRDMENVCRHYSEMGVKGFKVDFMDRDDQQMVDFIHRASETAAKYKLMLDFHGMYKPAGLERTYPNVLNFEGVNGLEQLKWSPPSLDMVLYDVQIPFIRMISGPMDYTQGAMRNASEGNYYPIYSEPMSQGTRCRQLALYVVFESPINMLCDNPVAYMKEPESLDFIAKIPTVWDESIALNGEVGKFVTIARRKGDDWYIGGITNWDARDMQIDLSFLANGSYQMTLFTDGINAHRKGTDYQRKENRVSSGEKLNIHLAQAGGFALKLEKLPGL